MPVTLSGAIRAWGVKVTAKADLIAKQEADGYRTEIITKWPIDSSPNRDTYVSADHWTGPDKVGHAHYRIINSAPYAGVIEYGGYPGVGPKTAQGGGGMLPFGVEINGGIYPTQVPSAPVRRAKSKRAGLLQLRLKELIAP